ncbi:hypothetical protein [Nonomuraea sp. 10N515B]|uniref:hypothetical protein n=1 Tax=Nonomuraea sp. 10N515B TaxID=3457422 RepID=UPI003FCED8FE
MGTIGSAPAADAKPYPPYPPREQATPFQDAKQTATRHQKRHQKGNSTVDLHVDERPYSHAPAVTGAGVLLAGTAGTIGSATAADAKPYPPYPPYPPREQATPFQDAKQTATRHQKGS